MVQLETTNVYSIISHLKYERHRRSKHQDIDETELELCPGPGAGDHSARAHGAGGQHGPVEQGEHLPHHAAAGDLHHGGITYSSGHSVISHTLFILTVLTLQLTDMTKRDCS